jgi:uridine kinase
VRQDLVVHSQSYEDLGAWVLSCTPRLGGTRLVLVDGPAGSGKTTFAGRLSRTTDTAPVLHMDDLYEGWGGLGEGVWRRLYDVLDSLGAGCVGSYQRYDWDAGRFAEWHEVAPEAAFIVEGVGSAHRGIDRWATLRVWVEADEEIRLERGVRRDGPALRDEWVRWMSKETAHFRSDRTRERADLLVDGSANVAETSFAVIEDRRGR